jgi:hypothetical protein
MTSPSIARVLPFSMIWASTPTILAFLHGARFRQKFTLEDAIGSHAGSLQASRRVPNGIPLGCPLPLTVATVNSDQTLKAVDLGTSFNWYPGVTAALWRGDTDKHCLLCKIPGNSTTWNYKDEKGAITFVKDNVEADRIQKEMLDGYDMDNDGRIDEHDFAMSMKVADRDSTESPHEKDGFGQKVKTSKTITERASAYQTQKELDKTPLDLSAQYARMRKGVKSGSSLNYIIKNFNYGQGMNFSWTLMPPHLAGLHSFKSHPANNSILYAFTPTCIAESYDTGDTWTACWNKTGLEGVQVDDLVWKDTKIGFVTGRSGVPHKTVDGGETWAPLNSTLGIASFGKSLLYSWTGKTLAMSGTGGSPGQFADHPHAGYVWTSTDDGETWEDQTGGVVTLAFGMAQWYEDKLYCASMGEGVFYKTLE